MSTSVSIRDPNLKVQVPNQYHLKLQKCSLKPVLFQYCFSFTIFDFISFALENKTTLIHVLTQLSQLFDLTIRRTLVKNNLIICLGFLIMNLLIFFFARNILDEYSTQELKTINVDYNVEININS